MHSSPNSEQTMPLRARSKAQTSAFFVLQLSEGHMFQSKHHDPPWNSSEQWGCHQAEPVEMSWV